MEGDRAKGAARRGAEPGRVAPFAPGRLFAGWKRAAEAPPSDLVVVEETEGALRASRVARGRGETPRILAATRPLPASGDPAARSARARAALAEMVTELGAKGCPAVAALGGADAVVRRLTMPRMAPRDLLAALELECRKQAQAPPGETVLRYERLEGAAASGTEQALVVAIAPSRRVDEWRALLSSAGLRPWSLTVAAAGLRADLARRGALSGDGVVAYLDVGQEQSQLVVLKGNDLRFSRDLAFGLSTMTAALRQIVVPGMGTVERSQAEAETLLREHGIPSGVEDARFSDGVPLAAAGIMLRPSLERLARELWNSFDYCNEQFLGEAVSRVVLLGPGGRTRHLDRHLAGVLKMPVGVADGATEGRAALASVSRGTLNFLEGAGSGGGVAGLAEAIPAPAVAVAALVLIVSIAAPAQWNVARARHEVASLRGELSRLSQERDAVARFRAAREEEGRATALLARLGGGGFAWSTLLRDLSHRVGADVRLTAFEVVPPAAAPGAPPASDGIAAADAAPRTVRLSGVLRSPRSSPERALAELLRSLAASPVFDRVRLEACERVSDEVSGFAITARLEEGAGS
ncbi:MAG TPA: pilus assembly protein PilM [Acidobacteriota bacterium]|nr:pilus assembly protein PilM [Acidobacteriota bacterium]